MQLKKWTDYEGMSDEAIRKGQRVLVIGVRVTNSRGSVPEVSSAIELIERKGWQLDNVSFTLVSAAGYQQAFLTFRR